MLRKNLFQDKNSVKKTIEEQNPNKPVDVFRVVQSKEASFVFEKPIFVEIIYLRFSSEALPNYYMRLYYSGELIVNRELNMNIM